MFQVLQDKMALMVLREQTELTELTVTMVLTVQMALMDLTDLTELMVTMVLTEQMELMVLTAPMEFPP